MNVDGADETEEPVAQNILNGRADLADEQFADLQAGLYYINVHTVEYPDGEIRGQVLEGEADMSAMGSVAASDALAKDDAAASTDTASEGGATSEDGVANGTDTVPGGDATTDSEVASKGEAATEEAPCGPRPQRPELARQNPAPRPTPWNGVVRGPSVGVVRIMPN